MAIVIRFFQEALVFFADEFLADTRASLVAADLFTISLDTSLGNLAIRVNFWCPQTSDVQSHSIGCVSVLSGHAATVQQKLESHVALKGLLVAKCVAVVGDGASTNSAAANLMKLPHFWWCSMHRVDLVATWLWDAMNEESGGREAGKQIDHCFLSLAGHLKESTHAKNDLKLWAKMMNESPLTHTGLKTGGTRMNAASGPCINFVRSLTSVFLMLKFECLTPKDTKDRKKYRKRLSEFTPEVLLDVFLCADVLAIIHSAMTSVQETFCTQRKGFQAVRKMSVHFVEWADGVLADQNWTGPEQDLWCGDTDFFLGLGLNKLRHDSHAFCWRAAYQTVQTEDWCESSLHILLPQFRRTYVTARVGQFMAWLKDATMNYFGEDPHTRSWDAAMDLSTVENPYTYEVQEWKDSIAYINSTCGTNAISDDLLIRAWEELRSTAFDLKNDCEISEEASWKRITKDMCARASNNDLNELEVALFHLLKMYWISVGSSAVIERDFSVRVLES